MTILQSTTNVDALTLRIAELEAALLAKTHASRQITLKVSDKGALSIYGLGRWPVTLYKSQAVALFAPETITRITTFLTTHNSSLVDKPRAD